MFFGEKRLYICITIFLLIIPVLESSEYDTLLQQLLKTKTDSERSRILEKNNEKLNKELISVLLAQGERRRLGFDYDEAMASFQSVKLISEKISDPVNTSAALRGIGSVHFIQARYDVAMEYYQQSYELSDKINDLAGKADALRWMSSVQSIHGKYEDKMKFLQDSLKIEESINNKAGIAASLLHIALYQTDNGEHELGFEGFKRCLKLAEEGGDQFVVGRALESLGLSYSYVGNYDRAMEYYKRAESVHLSNGHLAPLTNVLFNIAAEYYKKGNYREAMYFHLEALKIRYKSKNGRAIGFSLNEIGNIYADQGEYDLAMEYLNRSYQAVSESNDRYWIARVLSSIGTVYQLSGKPDKAIEYFNRSLREYQTIGYLLHVPYLFQSIAKTYGLKKEFQKASETYRKAFEMLEKVPHTELKVKLFEASAWNEYQLGYSEESSRLADEAIGLARTHELNEQLWSALLCKAKNLMKLQKQQEAEEALKESIGVLEGLRQQVAGGEKVTQQYMESRTEPYDAMIEFLIAEKRDEEAFHYAERAKARVLVDVMQKGQFDVTAAMTEEEKKEEAKLKEDLYVLNVKFREATSSDKQDEGTIKTLKTKLERARLNYDGFQNRIFAVHPELKVQRGEAEILSLEKARELLPDDRVAFLEYVVSKEKTYLLFLTRSTMAIQQIPIGEELLKENVNTFRNQISKRDPAYQRNARQLYNLLLAPINLELQQLQHAIVIPDGILWELPFQTLIRNDNRFVLEHTAISYAPSITALSEMQKLRQTKVDQPKILALANPALGKETTEKVGMVFRGMRLDPLPDAETEVKKLATLYGSDHSRIYLGPEAREAVLKQQIEKHDVIHLATHGILNEYTPMYSHLLFSRSGEKDPEDGMFEAWEIIRMKLNAMLVILSACETGRGRIGAGEGMVGLSWAFFVAGCPTTIVSQWKVESSSTADLMFRFHENFQKFKMSKFQALQQAALSILRNPDYRHPFYWASFIIVGNPNS